MKTLSKNLTLKISILCMSFALQTAALAGSKIDCNQTIYPYDSVVSEAMFKAGITPATSEDQATYAIYNVVSYDDRYFSDGLDGGDGLFIRGNRTKTIATALLAQKVRKETPNGPNAYEDSWIILDQKNKSTTHTHFSNSPPEETPDDAPVEAKAAADLIHDVCGR